MPGKLDDISFALGEIKADIRELKTRADEDRELVNARHSQSAKAIAELAQKLDQHAGAVEMLRPAVAALELSRSKLAAWATIGFGVIIVFGWIVEATIKLALAWAWSHLH